MAGTAASIWQMAHCLDPHNPLGQNGVLARVFERLTPDQIVRFKREAVSMDHTVVKVDPDGTQSLEKRPQAIGKYLG